jgi:hypothetical protein
MADPAAAAGSPAFIDAASDPELPRPSSNHSRSMASSPSLSPAHASAPLSPDHQNTASVVASPLGVGDTIEHLVQGMYNLI